MKTLLKNLFIVFGMPTLILLSCKSNNTNTGEVTKKLWSEQDAIPCQKKGISDNNFFRLNEFASSADMEVAKEKSFLLAKESMATLIKARMKSIIKRYTSESKVENDADFELKVETITKQAVDTEMKDIEMKCTNTVVMKYDRFRTFTALELSKKGFYKTLIKQSEKENLSFDNNIFKIIYNQEMANLIEEEKLKVKEKY